MWRFTLITAIVGLAVLTAGLTFAATPLRQTRAFRHAVACDCFEREDVHIRARRDYTSTSYDSDGHGTRTRHREVTWERADGTVEAKDVSKTLYDRAVEDAPAVLRLWHGEVVGVEIAGGRDQFLPHMGYRLTAGLLAAWLGLGLILLALLRRRWDGVFFLLHRSFSWLVTAVLPCFLVAYAQAYGAETGWSLFVAILFSLVLAAAGAWMLWITFSMSSDRRW